MPCTCRREYKRVMASQMPITCTISFKNSRLLVILVACVWKVMCELELDCKRVHMRHAHRWECAKPEVQALLQEEDANAANLWVG